ncbi:histidine phosphatase family protein [Roseomonas marmotae]|uniref:Histidine phosphatase family protein n=1 Tax=Roseomonas marmotae TaxID=2768161 RepID=A0ABS3KHC8_9PROT|nr:histidine phosphatase family protein [Roseomonas marmotae]MBO1076864.1 histidine phosphatase family protein [Roseomonas marmotae]QTI81115.1 histidine phosphatase family protein [Roseomonas marmotae]
MALTLFLLRHAAHDRVGDLLCGRMPGVPLGQHGRWQAARLAGRFPPGTLDALYTSPLQRCRETAAAIAQPGGPEPVPAPEAEEVDFGAWTGLGFTVLETDPRWRAWNSDRDHAVAPGGEAMSAVRQRVVALLKGLQARHPEGRVALISHAEIIRAAVLHLLSLPLQAYERLEVSPASVSTLALWPGGGKLLGLNDVAHLAANGHVAMEKGEPA